MSEYTPRVLDFAIEEDLADIYRHWHFRSQKYAGGDQLATALHLGWQAKEVVLLEKRWLGGARQINIFHFELTRGGDSIAMPVIGNPYVNRLIAEQGLRVVNLSKPAAAPILRRAYRPVTTAVGGEEAWA
ncbi:MAG: hypothetical protein BroJett038_29750 [Chloroflexota bacterium]|jgi:phytoene dehydrogenase-like protein|nr:hypothetical protein [Anaerolineae bacterium CFX8]GIL14255.1 MAG: hypothetical protein BroJett038_29750 [Chloroflexota bacterium]